MAHIAMVFPVLFGLLFFGSIAVFFVVFGIILKKAASRPPAYGAPNSFSAETACPLVSREAACLPLIRKDFPTFDPALAYAYARDALGRQLGNRPDFGVHQVVLADYQRSRYEKNVILQAALRYREASCLRQTRYILHYTYRIGDGQPLTAANCPNCGAPLSDPEAEACEYCDSLFLNPLDGSWSFTRIVEEFPVRP